MKLSTYMTLNDKKVPPTLWELEDHHIGKQRIFYSRVQNNTFFSFNFNDLKFFDLDLQLLHVQAFNAQIHRMDDFHNAEGVHISLIYLMYKAQHHGYYACSKECKKLDYISIMHLRQMCVTWKLFSTPTSCNTQLVQEGQQIQRSCMQPFAS